MSVKVVQEVPVPVVPEGRDIWKRMFWAWKERVKLWN